MPLDLLNKLLEDTSTAYESLTIDQRREFADGLLNFADNLAANEGMSPEEKELFAQQNVPYELSIFPVKPSTLDVQKLASFCGLLPYLRQLRRFTQC